MDEKRTHLAVHVSPSIFGIFEKYWPTIPITLLKMQWADKNPPMLMEKRASLLLKFFWFGFNRKNYLFVEISVLTSSWYTPK